MPILQHPEIKLAFCHIPRTGGVSICTALNLLVNDRHFPASYYRKTYPDHILFSVIRPYEDRIKSTFGYKVPEHYKQHGESLDQLVSFIVKRGFLNPGLMIKPNEYFLDCEVDYLLRFEFLQDDLNAMLTTIGHKKIQLQQSNSFR